MKPSFNYKSLVTIPAWQQKLLDGGETSDHIQDVATAYAKVPMIHRAVKMRCDALASVPVKIMKGNTEVDWPFKTPVDQLLWKTEAALLGDGRSIILKLKNRLGQVTGKIQDLQWLNPFTVTTKAFKDESNQIRLMFIQGGANYTQDDVVYIKEFSYSDDLESGNSVVEACLNDAALMNYQTRFASKFFESGAMPITLISADGVVLDPDEKQRIQSFFTKLTSGIRNAWRPLVTTTKLNPKIIAQDLDKMTIPDLYKQAQNNISTAFGIPVNMFAGDDNYASADSHRMQFWQDVVRPRGIMIQGEINRQLLDPMGLEMILGFDELDIFQEDERERADSFAIYVNAGMNPEVVIEMLGIDIPEGKQAMLPKPETVEVVPEKQPKELEQDEYTEEMAKWERKCIKRIKDGRNADCQFDSEIIPEGLQDEMHQALKLCVTSEEVKQVFSGDYSKPMDNSLLMELKRTNDILEKEVKQEQPSFNFPINVNVPPQTVNVSAEPTPIENNITVEPTPIENNVSVTNPDITNNINVPEQAAPVINVEPQVTINQTEAKGKVEVIRGRDGKIKELIEK